MTTLAEALPIVQLLHRGDKPRPLYFLVIEIAQEEKISLESDSYL